MNYRKLRIAWSVAWGIAAMLLLALWARSYWLADGAGYTAAAESLTVSSQNGTITVSKIYERNGNFFGSRKVEDTPTLSDQFSVGWFDQRDQNPATLAAAFPHWLVALPVILIAVAPWVRWRFTVRRLLIVTACVGGLLGLVVCCRKPHSSAWQELSQSGKGVFVVKLVENDKSVYYFFGGTNRLFSLKDNISDGVRFPTLESAVAFRKLKPADTRLYEATPVVVSEGGDSIQRLSQDESRKLLRDD